MTPETPIVTRFAPSPTGQLHIGGARTALFCWAFARKTGGRFLLRIEDTDRARSSESAERGIYECLAWLGIDWDDGPEFNMGDRTVGGDARAVAPFRQSERLQIYNDLVEQLVAEGKAYHAFDTPEDLDAKRKAAEANKQDYRYDRAALQLTLDERQRRAATDTHVVRLKVDETQSITVRDAVLGDVTVEAGQLDDFIIRKADGYPTYHFAVVVDDHRMGVTHVLRGQEHLNNTPKHVALMQALGYPEPVFAHMPLIFNERGAKMSKRERDQAARDFCKQQGIDSPPDGVAIDGDEFAGWLKDKKRQLETESLEALAGSIGVHLPEVTVEQFRAAGYLPEAINNFIALLGFTPSKHDDGTEREKFDLDFLASDFELERIGKSNARFDRQKLLAFNTDLITTMDAGAFVAQFRDWCARYRAGIPESLGSERFELLARAIQPQCKTFEDAADRCAFALMETESIAYDEKAVKKWLRKGEPSGLDVLRDVRETLVAADPFEVDPVRTAIDTFVETREIGMGKVAQPLRVALTGTAVSPSIAETLVVVGKDDVLARIDRCITTHQEQTQ